MRTTALLLALLLSSTALAQDDAATRKLLVQVSAASEVARAAGRGHDEYAQAESALLAAIADPQFAALAAEVRADIYASAAWGAIRLDDIPKARDYVEHAATAFPEGSGYWHWLALIESRLEHHDAAAAALTRYLSLETEDGLEQAADLVNRMIPAFDPASKADVELLRLLAKQKWHSDDPSEGLAWYALALAEADAGNEDAARAAIRAIRTPGAMVLARSDKRLDGLYERESPDFDPVQLARKRVKDLQDDVNQQPNRLRARIDLGAAMLVLGQDAEVLTLSDHLLEGVESGLIKAEDPEQLPWVRNQRTSALLHLGRVEEGLQYLRVAAATPVDGHANVSQALNLAGVYCDLGRGAEDLQMALPVQNMSGYGRIVQAYAVHCGARLTGDTGTAQAQMDYLREHREEGRQFYLSALLREDRLDEAAAQVIQWLDGKQSRGEILLAVQDFRDVPVASPAARKMDALWEKLVTRKDVMKAINRVGRREYYDIVN